MKRRGLVTAGLAGLTVAIVAAFAHDAHAQDANASATAEALFAEGRRLMLEGKVEQACPKFEGAQRVAPTPGTLLNLANCYEKAGRVASAWASFREAVSMSRSAGRNDLADSAQKRAAALEPKLARLAIVVAAPAPSQEVTRDGAPVPREAWSTPVPIDPGEHAIDARAPGRKPVHLVATAPAEGATATLQVPELEVDPTASAARTPEPARSSMATVPPPTDAQPRVAEPPHGATVDENRGATQRTLGIVSAGLGVAGLVVGGVFAARAGSKNSDSKAECRPEDPNKCTDAGKQLRDDARGAGNVATIGFGAGVVLLGAGAALFFTAPKSGSPSVAIAPTINGAMLHGSFQ